MGTPKTCVAEIASGFCGPFLGHSFVVIVDAFCTWPDIIPMYSITLQATITVLLPLFATHGLPVRVVTANGPQFCSSKFSLFLKVYGTGHTKPAPYHCATNGQAERFVQTFKHNMKCRRATSSNVISHVIKFPLTYKTTEHSAPGQTPSHLLMGRKVRTKLDLFLSAE